MIQNYHLRIAMMSFFILLSCTFGSVGDSQKEEALILQNLLRLGREVPSSLKPVLLGYDNQIDDDLNQFTITSSAPMANTNYNFTIVPSSSYMEINRIEFRFNPPGKIAGVFDVQSKSSTKTHTPYTVPLDLPSSDPYGKIYSSKPIRINAYTNKNSEGIGLGSVFRQEMSLMENIPQGVVASTVVYFDRLDLKADITRPNANPNRTIILSFRDVSINFPTRCKITMTGGKTTEWLLGFRYSNLFRDLVSPTKSVLDAIYLANPTNGSTIVVTDLDPLYSDFYKNFDLADNVFIQDTCNL